MVAPLKALMVPAPVAGARVQEMVFVGPVSVAVKLTAAPSAETVRGPGGLTVRFGGLMVMVALAVRPLAVAVSVAVVDDEILAGGV